MAMPNTIPDEQWKSLQDRATAANPSVITPQAVRRQQAQAAAKTQAKNN